MNIVKILYAGLMCASLLLGGHLTYLMGQKSVPTKDQVRKQLDFNVYSVTSYDGVKIVKGKERFKNPRFGTGFVVYHKSKQFIVTNAHVCGGQKRLARLNLNEELKINLKIIKSDRNTDLCLLEQADMITKLNPILGIQLNDKAPVQNKIYGSLGYNGLNYKVAQLGELLGRRYTFAALTDIDHKPTNRGNKINNMRLPLAKRKAFCKEPNQLEMIPHPMKMMLQAMGAPKEELDKIPDLLQCWMAELQDVYDFHIVGGSSGSPVIDLKTGKLVGVVSQFVHDQRHYGGVIPFDVVKKFLDKHVK